LEFDPHAIAAVVFLTGGSFLICLVLTAVLTLALMALIRGAIGTFPGGLLGWPVAVLGTIVGVPVMLTGFLPVMHFLARAAKHWPNW
jgi:hypothetical protein